MPIYISLLRGINVSGKHLIKMNTLKSIYQKLGLQQVVTYIQSGNVIFCSLESDIDLLEQVIETAIFEATTFAIPVKIITLDQLENSLQMNPFLKNKAFNKEYFHITFLKRTPKMIDLLKIEQKMLHSEAFEQLGDCLFIYCPEGYGKTKLTTPFLERVSEQKATTRNWKTMNRLYSMAITLKI